MPDVHGRPEGEVREVTRAATKITEAKSRKIYEAFVAHYKSIGHDIRTMATTEQGCDREIWYSGYPVLCRNLEDSGVFGIAWESGDYEWPFDDVIFDLSEKFGVMIEPMNGWAVGFYPV